MFEKFTDRAHKVLRYAQEEARRFHHSFVGSEHLLLGLCKVEDGIASRVLSSCELRYEQFVSLIQSQKEHTSELVDGHIPFSARAKKILEGALRESLSLGQNYISTEHILLGLLQQEDGRAIALLNELQADKEELIKATQELMKRETRLPFSSSNTSKSASSAGGVLSFDAPDGIEPASLSEYGRNLTQDARLGKLDPVFGRDLELERVMQILARRTKNNPLILGDPGVGKTAIAEGLAQLIAANQVPDMLQGKELWTLDLAALIAGAKYRGEFEDRLKRIVVELSSSQDKILFIDEMHTLIGAGAAEGSIDAASILKPALSRGEIQIIAATTLDEYRKHVEKDSAFERRFQPVVISEPNQEEAIKILEGLRQCYEDHHKVHFSDEALQAAVSLSDRYVQDRFLPDKAIDIMDEAGARIRLRNNQLPPELLEIDDKLAAVREQKEEAAAHQDYEKAAMLRDQEKALLAQRSELDDAWKTSANNSESQVTPEDIAQVVSMTTGVPVTNLTEAETEKLLRMEEVLHERVIGQHEAVLALSKAMRRSRAGLKDPKRPAGSFLFLGPSGVGKTELAKTLAEFLFGTEESLLVLDMSEFMEKHSVSRLVGSPPGYVGYDEGGQLTKMVRQKPYSVVLFDEIEKAHPDVFNVLLQIFEEGRLTDSRGRKVDFKNCIIVMTSNIGAHEIAKGSSLGFSQQKKNQAALSYKEIKASVMTELKRSFRPEFINRLDEVIVFRSLEEDEIVAIVDLMVDELRARLYAQGMSLYVTQEAKLRISKDGIEPSYGARPLRRAIQNLVEDPLSEQLLQGCWKEGDLIKVDVDEHNELTFTKMEGELIAPKKREHIAQEQKTAFTPSKRRGKSSSGSQLTGNLAQ